MRLREKYKLGEVIGRGGMGIVYAAVGPQGERVAVKIIRADLASDTKVMARFQRERDILCSISHRNVVRIVEFCADDEDAAIVMERIDGGDLRAYVDRMGGTLSVDHAFEVGIGILDGLAAVHAAGVVHRDVKPANVLMSVDADGTQQPRLSDFGVSRMIDESGALTTHTNLIGTPLYLAPELSEGGRAEPKSDLYSVGCLLYELIAGHPPFTGTAFAVLRSHAFESPAPIPEIGDRAGAALQYLMAKNPTHRPASAHAAADALRGAMDRSDGASTVPGRTAPTLSRRRDAIEREPTTKLVARRPNRTRALIAAAVLFVLVAGAAAAFASKGDDAGGAEVKGTTNTRDVSATSTTADQLVTTTVGSATTAAPSTTQAPGATTGPIATNGPISQPGTTSTATGSAPVTESPPPTPTIQRTNVSIAPGAVQATTSGAVVSFSTNVCTNAEYSYRSADGSSSGVHRGEGYPAATRCWTTHEARLGEWTPALTPATQYELAVTAVAADGSTTVWNTSFRTADPVVVTGVAIQTTPTTAIVSFKTNTCSTARYAYQSSSPPTSGAHQGETYPAPTKCWLDHEARLGEWTPPLTPGTTYSLTLTVIASNGAQTTWTGQFVTK